ncbi:MAG: hypothetical protein QXI60_06410 [Thermofilaceae archaeon]
MAVRAKFLLWSNSGDCWNLVPKLQEEGYEAVLYVHNDSAKHIADGLVDKVDDYLEVLKGDRSREWIIVFDTIGRGRIADELRRYGWKVIGASSWADRVEKDREFAAKTFLACGIPIPETYVARNLDEAAEYIRERPNRYVLKPHDNKVFVYVADGVEDALECIEMWKEEGLGGMTVSIQRYIKGRNVDVEMWFGNGMLLFPANYTVETKKFLVDDLGQTVGCMSSVVWASYRLSRTAKEGVIPLERVTRKVGYSGPISVNIMVSDRSHRLYALEFTPRFGYNAFYCLWELLPAGVGDLLLRCVNYTPEDRASSPFMPIDTTKFAVAARVSIPPYPLELGNESLEKRVYQEVRGVPVKLSGNYPAKVYGIDVMRDEHGRIVCAGIDGIIAEVVASADDPVEAWRKVVRTVKQLKIPNKQARLRDGIEDFLNYYDRWVEYNIVGPTEDIERIPAPEGIKEEEKEEEANVA